MFRSSRPLIYGLCCLPILGWQAFAQEALPPLPDKPTEFEFVSDGSWPPVLKGMENIKIIDIEPSRSSVTPAYQARVSEIALSSAKIRALLGKRFVFAGAAILEEDKAADDKALEQRSAKVDFYSYDRNVAVRAVVRQGEVVDASDLEGYQPPETSEEVAQAAKIAQEDTRFAESTGRLEVHGLITEVGEGAEGAGNRLLYLSYEKPGSAVAEYFALVDLTKGKLIQSGPVATGQ